MEEDNGDAKKEKDSSREDLWQYFGFNSITIGQELRKLEEFKVIVNEHEMSAKLARNSDEIRVKFGRITRNTMSRLQLHRN